jgi:hypothetical protein
MDKITKQDTMLWINHAVARFNGLGRNQKNLAETLGIEEARLSEMKGGKGTISPNLIEKIVDLCGAPKRGKGRFEYTEVYKSLDDFLGVYCSTSNNRFYNRLVKALSSNEYIEELLGNVFLEIGVFDNQSDESRLEIISNLINEVIQSPEFGNLCTEYKEGLKSSTTLKFEWKNYRPQGVYSDVFMMKGLIIDKNEVFHALYLQWLLLQKYPEYVFANKDKLDTEVLPDLIPVIITGDRILTLEKHNLSNSCPINRNSINEFGPTNDYPELVRRFSCDEVMNTKPEFWSDVRCELYLGEAMNYHLLIHLSPRIIGYKDLGDLDETERNKWETYVDKEDRIAVIANINSLSLLNDMEELRKWCGLPTDNHCELKQSIARNGGYVPGATVLV